MAFSMPFPVPNSTHICKNSPKLLFTECEGDRYHVLRNGSFKRRILYTQKIPHIHNTQRNTLKMIQERNAAKVNLPLNDSKYATHDLNKIKLNNNKVRLDINKLDPT